MQRDKRQPTQITEPVGKLTMYKVAPVNISTAEMLDTRDAHFTPQDAMNSYGQMLPRRDSSERYGGQELQLFEIQVIVRKNEG